MKFTIQEERPISSFEDLEVLKRDLIRKSDKKAEKIRYKIDKITTTTDLQDVYDEVLAKFDLQHGLMNMLPMLLKYKDYIINSKVAQNVKDTVKKPKFVFWSTFLGVFSSFAYFQLRKRGKMKQESLEDYSDS